MEHDDEIEQRPVPETPQSVWQSLHPQEEPGMEMSLTTDQLFAKARYRERENIWAQWIGAAICFGFAATFLYRATAIEQLWSRLALAWMALLMMFAFVGIVRKGARRMQAGESCAQFMVRELEGSRRTLLSVRWFAVLSLPTLLLPLWGALRVMQASGLLHRNLSLWPHPFVTSVWAIGASLLVLLAIWVGMGLEAEKRARQAEELRRAIRM